MQNTEPKNSNDFMIEKLKDRPVNKKKLLKRTLITALMAVIFGLIACITFQLLEPVISNWLYPQPKEGQIVLFPEDKVEMKPEDMLSDNLPNPENNSGVGLLDGTEGEGTIASNGLSLDYLNYLQMYESLAGVVETLNKSLVRVTATKVNKDWLSNEYETKNDTMGVIIGKNGKEALILTDYSSIKDTDNLRITLFDDSGYPVELKQYHTDSDIAILTLDISMLGGKKDEFTVASFANSSEESLLCMPVIALGSPLGECGSVGYGMITSESTRMSMVDASYKVLRTDIYGSSQAKGFLFNLKGQIIGLITRQKSSQDMKNMITAFGISDMKNLISMLSGDFEVGYMGITGIDVTREANELGQVPLGVYVQEVEENSPALRAGIQKGDIIVGIDDSEVSSYSDFAEVFGKMKSGQMVKLTVMRQSVNEYTKMTFSIILGKAK